MRVEGSSSFFLLSLGSLGSLGSVAAPSVFPNVFFERCSGCVEVVSESCLEGCGLEANYGNRGHRPRLQWRLSRLRRCFGFGFFGSQTVPVWIVFIARARRSDYLLTHKPWLADPGRGAERFLAGDRMRRSGFGAVF